MLAACVAALGTAGCSRINSHQGYVVDPDLVNSIQPGIDNRESVEKTLGQPTLSDQFGGNDWVYISRNSKNMAFNNPRPDDQTTIRVQFDAKGSVRAVTMTGVELAQNIKPMGEKTPTLGRKRGFFEDLFGNIGTVGAGGGGPGGNDNTGGGGP
jgi:outer membrane protein assembly factor BamE (lipoprotein component of BamABCDE complex)